MGKLSFSRSFLKLFVHQDVETEEDFSQKEKCYLMNNSEEQCNTEMPCLAPSCYHGDIGCDGEKPAGKGCPGKMEFNNEPGFIHWGCANEDGQLSSPYDQSPGHEKIPAETICTTASR